MGPGFESLKVHQRIRDTAKAVQGIYMNSRAEMRMNKEKRSRTKGKNQRFGEAKSLLEEYGKETVLEKVNSSQCL